MDAERLSLLGWQLAFEHTAIEAYRALTDRGIGTRVIKGLAHAALLYPEGETRVYADIDLLVDPSQFRQALSTLAAVGWTPPLEGQRVAEQSLHSWTLERERHGRRVQIDLHHRLHGVGVSSRKLWRVASADPIEIDIDGHTLLTTSLPVTLFHLGVATRPEVGGNARHVEEFRRLLALDAGLLPRAQALARELKANYAFGRGLALVEGRTDFPSRGLPTDTQLGFWLSYLRFAPDNRARLDFIREAAHPPAGYAARAPGASLRGRAAPTWASLTNRVSLTSWASLRDRVRRGA